MRLVENALVDAKADPCLRWSHIHLVGNAVVQIKLIKSMDIPNKTFIEIYIMLSCFFVSFSDMSNKERRLLQWNCPVCRLAVIYCSMFC